MNLKTRRTIRVTVESRLKAGDSKQTVYRELKDQFGADPFIRKVLSEVPSLEVRKKHARINHILIILLICIAAVKVGFIAVGMISHTPAMLTWLLLPIGIQVVLIVMIHGWNRMSYLLTAIYGALQLFDQAPSGEAAHQIIKLLFAARQFLWAVALALAVYLYFKLNEGDIEKGLN